MTLLTRPDTIFEANFYNTEDGASWTNLSDYVELQEGISISRRRQVIFDEVSSGSFAVTLDNSLGTFNNERSDLEFTGLINIDVPVRYRARWPRVPTDSINMLTDTQATSATDDDFFAEQGGLDLETSAPPTGQDQAIIWNTGVLATTSARVLTGDFYSRSADDDLPMYVEPSTEYTASAKVKDDTSGTGITFKVSARILWYDKTGQLISESTGSLVTLTTSYQTVSVSDTSPATAYSARMAIANETLVSPASAAIALTGRTKDAVNRGGEFTHLVVPQEANVGDLAIVWLYSNSQPTFSQADATWTNLDSYTDSRGKTSVWYKILKAADIGVRTEWKINQTGKRWVAVMTTYSGVNQTTPINAHSHSTETTFQTGHTTPSVTTTSSNCWIQSAVFDTSSTTSVWTPPGTETLRQDVYCVGGNAATGIVTDNATAVATGAHTGSSFSSNVKSRFSSMSRVAIAPSTGTGPGSVAVTMGAWQFEQSASASAWVAAGHWKDLFKGLTDSWSKTWNGDLSLMEVQATDRSKQLSANNVGSAISETVLETLPQAYYQLGESGDTSTTEGANSALVPQDGIKALQVGTGGTLEWGSGVGPPIDGQAAVITTNVDRTDGLMLTVSLANPIVDASEITLMGWYTSSDAVAAYGTLFKLISLGAGVSQVGFVELGIHPGTPQMRAYGYIKSEITTFETTATVGTNYNDGKTHFIVDVVTLDGGNLTSTLYVDGVQKATDSVACTFTTFPPITVINVGGNTAGTSPNQLMSATFSHAAAVPFAVDADTIANIYTAGTTAFAGDTVDQRIGRIGDWANIEDLNLDASMTICGRHMPDTQSVLNAIQQAARTDGGTSFVDDDGSVTFLSRERKEATASPWLTVDAGEVDVNTSEITDDQLLVNQATIKRLGANSTQISSDLASQVLHGIYDKDVDTIQQDVDDAKYNGQYLTAFYAEPTQRCDSITIEALFLNQWDVLLTQEMWNIIEITGLPSIEESTTLDLYVEGWSYSIDDKSWQITYDTSAAIQFAILNDSARDVVGTVVVAW